MDILSIVLIAVGLSMDAFAVSVTNGIIIRDLRIGHALKVGLYFGVFQALMPFINLLAIPSPPMPYKNWYVPSYIL